MDKTLNQDWTTENCHLQGRLALELLFSDVYPNEMW